LKDRIEALQPWFQHIVFPDGTEVGTWPTEAKCEALTEGLVLEGKSALDIACMSGAATLWLERQGCAVRGCDIADFNADQFAVVKEAFEMRAEYDHCSVYDLPAQYAWRFNVVLMMGLYYHLKHPLLGLERAWEVTDEVLLIEGEVDRFGWDVPARATFYKDQYLGDPTNWWVPTVKCLEDWCWCLEGAQKVEIIYPMLVPSRAGVRVWRTGG
jgi:tRNA (mo5U34)-methyltransferase